MEKMINEEATFVIEGVCLFNSYVSEYPAQMGGDRVVVAADFLTGFLENLD